MDDYQMGDDYSTAGETEYQTVGQARYPLARGRVLAPGATRAPYAPVMAPASRLVRTMMPAAASSAASSAAQLTEDRVRAIVRDEIGARVPYGDIPPRPVDGEAMFPLGLGSITFVAPPGPTEGYLTAFPQRAFRGERLVLQISRNGASAAPILVLLTEFSVGDYRQFVGGGELPADVFAADAFGVRLMLDGAAPGVAIRIGLRITGGSLAGTDTIVVSGALIGRATDAPRR